MKIKKRYAIPAVLVVGLFAGPRQHFEAFDASLPELGIELEQVDGFVKRREGQVANLKPDNEARIIWADSVRKTPFSVVYLHGWSASPMEGSPVVQEFAKRYGLNLYLHRLTEHGLSDKDAFGTLTPKKLVDSAKEALAIGKLLGEKAIIMSCSTGGTLSIYLAATHPDEVAAQFLYSPNIGLADATSELLTMPWGKQIAGMMIGEYRSFTPPKGGEKYWTTTYPTKSLICLKSLMESTMKKEIWAKVRQPLFMAYYYKNEKEKDPVVSVPEMKEFYEGVGTPIPLKKDAPLADVRAHVVLSDIHSKDLASVRKETFGFAESVLGLRKLEIGN